MRTPPRILLAATEGQGVVVLQNSQEDVDVLCRAVLLHLLAAAGPCCSASCNEEQLLLRA